MGEGRQVGWALLARRRWGLCTLIASRVQDNSISAEGHGHWDNYRKRKDLFIGSRIHTWRRLLPRRHEMMGLAMPAKYARQDGSRLSIPSVKRGPVEDNGKRGRQGPKLPYMVRLRPNLEGGQASPGELTEGHCSLCSF